MKFLTQFATLAQFNNFTLDSTNTPNVSLIKDNNNYGIQYTKYIPPVTPVHDYSQDYFTIEAIDNISELILFYANDYETELPISTTYYSLDNGNTWSEMSNTVSLSSGNKIMFKGTPSITLGSNMQTIYINGDNSFVEHAIDGRFNVSGNIMSLIYGDNFIGQTSFPVSFEISGNEFLNLFFNQTNLVNANNLILPALTMQESCYSGMFSGCTSLTTAPELPATTLERDCYSGMFSDCTALTTAPELPATELATSCYSSMFDGCTALTTAPELPATELYYESCYEYMFYNCTALTTAPELPATELADSCYSSMFQGCTSLTTAPELPATTLVYNGYTNMFKNCSSLNYVKCLAVDNIYESSIENWLSGVASSGTFVKDSTADWTEAGDSGIPTGWTVQDA